MLILLAVHDSDQVHNIYAADSEEEMLEQLKESKWWEDIVDRLQDEMEEDINESTITLNHITQLYHDGDSSVGYSLNHN